MAWRLAYSLDTLRNQVNAAYPNRSKLSDGTIGDPAHAATASDHNPNAAGVVCALDLTHDPANFDAHATANRLLTNRHPNLKYLISNRRIAGDWTGWKWVAYNGVNPHDKHIHISVGVGPDGKSVQPYDDRTNWSIIGEVMDNNIIKKEDLDLLRIIATEIEGWDYNDTHAGKNDELLLKTFVGLPFKTVTRNMFHNPNSTAYRAKKAAAFTGSEFKPYDGSQLYLKK